VLRVREFEQSDYEGLGIQPIMSLRPGSLADQVFGTEKSANQFFATERSANQIFKGRKFNQ
jgi:hypothetical protein